MSSKTALALDLSSQLKCCSDLKASENRSGAHRGFWQDVPGRFETQIWASDHVSDGTHHCSQPGTVVIVLDVKRRSTLL